MLIHLSQIEETAAEHMLGGDGTIYLRRFMDDAGKIMLVRVQPGCSIGMHTHETSSEICYILSGHAKVLYDGEVRNVCASLYGPRNLPTAFIVK